MVMNSCVGQVAKVKGRGVGVGNGNGNCNGNGRFIDNHFIVFLLGSEE